MKWYALMNLMLQGKCSEQLQYGEASRAGEQIRDQRPRFHNEIYPIGKGNSILHSKLRGRISPKEEADGKRKDGIALFRQSSTDFGFEFE